jgi:hypothetical protein
MGKSLAFGVGGTYNPANREKRLAARCLQHASPLCVILVHNFLHPRGPCQAARKVAGLTPSGPGGVELRERVEYVSQKKFIP